MLNLLTTKINVAKAKMTFRKKRNFNVKVNYTVVVHCAGFPTTVGYKSGTTRRIFISDPSFFHPGPLISDT
jgi:hypothetical protein